MWLIVTLITCVTIQLETATSFPPSPPTISLPLPSCWGMWAFTTTPRWQRHITYMPRRHRLHRPHATHVDHATSTTHRIPSWPQHVNVHHATSTPPCQPLPHQPCHPNDESLMMGHEKRRRTRWDEMGQGGSLEEMGQCEWFRKGQDDVSYIGSHVIQLHRHWQWRKPWRAAWTAGGTSPSSSSSYWLQCIKLVMYLVPNGLGPRRIYCIRYICKVFCACILHNRS